MRLTSEFLPPLLFCSARHINATQLIAKVAWMLLVDSFASPMCVKVRPEVYAVAALLLASKLCSQNGFVDESASVEQALQRLGLDSAAVTQAACWIGQAASAGRLLIVANIAEDPPRESEG
jgi:hypothetical protein